MIDPQGRPFVGRLYLGIHARGKGTSFGTSVTVDDDGRAGYRQIVPGEYDLSFEADSVGKTVVQVTVAPGENPLVIRLE